MSKFNVFVLIVVNFNFAVKDVVDGSGGDFDNDSTGSNVFKLTKLLISFKTLESVESSSKSPPEPTTSTPATSLTAKLKLKQY